MVYIHKRIVNSVFPATHMCRGGFLCLKLRIRPHSGQRSKYSGGVLDVATFSKSLVPSGIILHTHKYHRQIVPAANALSTSCYTP